MFPKKELKEVENTAWNKIKILCFDKNQQTINPTLLNRLWICEFVFSNVVYPYSEYGSGFTQLRLKWLTKSSPSEFRTFFECYYFCRYNLTKVFFSNKKLFKKLFLSPDTFEKGNILQCLKKVAPQFCTFTGRTPRNAVYFANIFTKTHAFAPVLWIQIHWIWIRIQDFSPIWIRIQPESMFIQSIWKEKIQNNFR